MSILTEFDLAYFYSAIYYYCNSLIASNHYFLIKKNSVNLYFQEFSDKIPSHFELNANLYTEIHRYRECIL